MDTGFSNNTPQFLYMHVPCVPKPVAGLPRTSRVSSTYFYVADMSDDGDGFVNPGLR